MPSPNQPSEIAQRVKPGCTVIAETPSRRAAAAISGAVRWNGVSIRASTSPSADKASMRSV